MTQSTSKPGHLGEMADGLSSPALDHLFTEGHERKFSPGQSIITEGTPTDYFYDIISGTVALARNGSDGRRQILSFMGARQFLGVSSTPSYPNLASALTDVVAIAYPRSALENALRTTPEFASRFRLVLTRILESSHDHIYTIGQRSAIERLASFLIYLRRNQARFAPEGPRPLSTHIDLPMTRLDIADFLGLTIETVSRAFSALKKKEIIAFTDSHSADILNMDRLRQLGGREDFTDKRGQA